MLANVQNSTPPRLVSHTPVLFRQGSVSWLSGAWSRRAANHGPAPPREQSAEALERDVQRLQIEARAELSHARSADESRATHLSLVEARRQRCRQARYERYQAVIDLGSRGDSQLTIAKKLGVSAGTVARWLHARGFPERQIRRDRQRDRARCLQPHERGLTPPTSRTHCSSGRVASLFMKREHLSAEQQGLVEAFLRFCPKARRLRRLALQFRAMLRWRQATRLTAWMNTAASSGFSFLAQFARTLQRDLAAMEQALTTRWSNGPVEGHINRLKMIKRQMYGRAGVEQFEARKFATATL